MSRSTYYIVALAFVVYLSAVSAQETTTPYSARGACLNRPRPAGYAARDPIKLAMSPWSSAYLNAYIASIILDEAIGVRNEIVETADQGQVWHEISQGNIHALLEYW
jgi:ABC-type proline/glycine betaine transport system substrate-binding protein